MSRSSRETRRCSRSSRGFTLVELLVALLVLSLMLALVGGLLRSFILQTGTARYTYAERAMKFYWLNSAINSMFFYVIKTPARMAGEGRDFIEFFNGQPDSMTFITNSPLTLKGVVLERLFFKEGALYMNETPIFSPDNDYADPMETFETRRTCILEKITDIRFTYLKRPRKIPDMGLQALGGPLAMGLNSGDENDPTKITETARLENEVPAGVKLSVAFDDGRNMDYCFRVQSDFVHKKDMTYGNYHGL